MEHDTNRDWLVAGMLAGVLTEGGVRDVVVARLTKTLVITDTDERFSRKNLRRDLSAWRSEELVERTNPRYLRAVRVRTNRVARARVAQAFNAWSAAADSRSLSDSAEVALTAADALVAALDQWRAVVAADAPEPGAPQS